MDRRDFLKVGGAAALTGGVAAPLSAAPERPAPVIRDDARPLTLAAGDLWHLGPSRLAQRIETATGGRYRIAVERDAAAPDLRLAATHHDEALHAAFAFFAGLPCGLDAEAHDTWLAVGGGQMLWDELAAGFGWKPLLTGRSGAGAGLWSTRRLETAADLAGAAVHAQGAACAALAALGARPVSLPLPEIAPALAAGRLAAAEWLGPPMPMAGGDMNPLAERLYQPGLTPGGTTLALNVRLELWRSLDAADQAILEACAAEECRLARAEALAYAGIARQIAEPAKWPVRQDFSPAFAAAHARACAEAVERIAATDADARRIADSHAAFRRLLGEPALA